MSCEVINDWSQKNFLEKFLENKYSTKIFIAFTQISRSAIISVFNRNINFHKFISRRKKKNRRRKEYFRYDFTSRALKSIKRRDDDGWSMIRSVSNYTFPSRAINFQKKERKTTFNEYLTVTGRYRIVSRAEQGMSCNVINRVQLIFWHLFFSLPRTEGARIGRSKPFFLQASIPFRVYPLAILPKIAEHHASITKYL